MPRILRTRVSRRTIGRAAALGLCLGAAAAGCDDFITGEGLTRDPNNATEADALQLFVGAQASIMNQQEGQLARLASMWTQQIAGIFNQQLNYGSQYNLTEGDVNTFWNQAYTGGGLVDIRKLRTLAQAAGDEQLEGRALFLEAFRVGTVTSLWGDVPYSEAIDPAILAPRLDPQEEIYEAIQAKLDTAIARLGGAGPGPLAGADAFYGTTTDAAQRNARWIRAAYTLKARYHMHTAERLGAPAYQAALSAAQRGIDEAPTSNVQAWHGQGPGDFRPWHGNTFNDGNIWAQFQLGTRQDITAALQMVALLRTRDDPRLAAYFDSTSTGAYAGADQFGRSPAGGTSNIDRETRTVLTFRQPYITWAENQLIIAEAQLRLGNATAALAATNAVRVAVGLAALPGPITLEEIALEQYIALFQNIEAYNVWKRTCWPRLVPGGTNFTSAAQVPARPPYALSERQANPNVPTPGAAVRQNWNDPDACPLP